MIDSIHYRWLKEHCTTTQGGLVVCIGDQRVSPATGHATTADLFKSLGYERVYDIDYNGNAFFNHDLNLPLPDNIACLQASLVYDGGTCEHVCNIGRAFSTMAKLCRIGGFVIQESPIVPYGQAYYGIDPQVQRDFFRTNGFKRIMQRLHYRRNLQMTVLHILVRFLPKRVVDRIADRARRIKGAKEFIFHDNPRDVYLYPDAFEDRHCYYVHPQTRTFYMGQKIANPPITWPAMECYPPAV